jgi:hypothetical protein
MQYITLIYTPRYFFVWKASVVRDQCPPPSSDTRTVVLHDITNAHRHTLGVKESS